MDKRESGKSGAIGGSPKPAVRAEARAAVLPAAPTRESSAGAGRDGDLEKLAAICANDWDEV